MTQSSRPQADNRNNGYDDAGPYSRDQWAERIRAAHTGDGNTASGRTRIRGVVPTYDNLLVPTISGTSIIIGTGAGIVYGSYLFNNAAVTFSTQAAVANSRIGVLCMVENNTNAAVAVDSGGNTWTYPTDLTDYDLALSVPAYMARLVLISGADAAIPVAPTLDQLTTLYCVPIAQYEIDNAVPPNITNFVDLREFVDIEQIVGVATGDDDTIEEALIIGTQVTNGTGDDGLGVAIRAKLENDNGDLEDAGQISVRWTDSTNGSEDARLELRLASGNADNLSAVINAPTAASADGNARGAGAVDLQQIRGAAAQVASGDGAFMAGRNNIASGDYSVAIGNTNEASGLSAYAEGVLNEASGDYSHAEGSETLASGENSHAEGSLTTASGEFSHAGGEYAIASKYGQFSRSGGVFDIGKPTQYSDYHLHREITHSDANWYEIRLNPLAASTLTLINDQVMTFDVLIVGTTQGCTKSFAYRIVGIIENDGGTTSLLASTVTTIFEDDADFNARASADDPNDALLIEVTDATSGGDVVRWSAIVRCAEVTYP